MASDDTSPAASLKNPSPEKPKGASRKKKSASQTEVLERAYAEAKYPSETTRSVLSRELGLSDKQLQVWFTHRRYKDRRDGIDDEKLISNSRRGKYETNHHHAEEGPGSSKKGEIIDLNMSREDDDSEDGYPARVLAEEHYDEELIAEHGNGVDVSNGGHEEFAKPKPKPVPRRRSTGPRDPNMPPRRPGPQPKMNAQAAAELAAILAVESQLGGPLRDDGPPLGFEFDPLPPDAFQQLAMTEVPYTVAGSREGESENNSDRAGSGMKLSIDFGVMDRKKKKIGVFPKTGRGESEY